MPVGRNWGLQNWTAHPLLFWQVVHWRHCVIRFFLGLKITLNVYFEIVFFVFLIFHLL